MRLIPECGPLPVESPDRLVVELDNADLGDLGESLCSGLQVLVPVKLEKVPSVKSGCPGLLLIPVILREYSAA